MPKNIKHTVGEAFFYYGFFTFIATFTSPVALQIVDPYWSAGSLVVIALGLLLTTNRRYAVIYRSFDALDREKFLERKVASILSMTRCVLLLNNPRYPARFRTCPTSLWGIVFGVIALFFGDPFVEKPSIPVVALIAVLTTLLFIFFCRPVYRTRVFNRARDKGARQRLFNELGFGFPLWRRYIPRLPRMIVELKVNDFDWFSAALICASRSDFIVFDVSNLRKDTALEQELKSFRELSNKGKVKTVALIWKEYDEAAASILKTHDIDPEDVLSDDEIDRLSVWALHR